MASEFSPEKVIGEEPSAKIMNTSIHKHSSFHSNASKQNRKIRNAASSDNSKCPIPVLRAETTDAEKYDLDKLLDVR